MEHNLIDSFLAKINSSEFNQLIINLANECMAYVSKSKIKTLNNKIDGSPLSESDIKIDKMIRERLSSFEPENKNIK